MIQKKQPCYFSLHNVEYVDYKDVESLKKFTNPHARMMARKRTGICAKHQRMFSQAIKRARFMGLLPFVAR